MRGKKEFSDFKLTANVQVTRDEFGGYCCKRFNETGEEENEELMTVEENICKLLGLDIERKALEIVRRDITKRGVPFGALALSTPHVNARDSQFDFHVVSTPQLKTQAQTPLTKILISPKVFVSGH